MTLPQEHRLVTEVPGPRSRELWARREKAIPAAVFNTVPVFVERAEGGIVEDVDGNRLIDFGAGLAVLNVGNTSPAVVKAVTEQAERYLHTCFHVTLNEPYVALAERLNELTPGDHEKRTMLVNSGAEAVENAVKLARYATRREKVVTFEHAFHGRTLMAMSLTAKEMPYKKGFGPFAPEVYRLPFAYPYRCPSGQPPESCGPSCVEAVLGGMEEMGPETIAAVVVEPVQGEGGFIVPPPEFLPALAEFCRSHGILLVADEVQTGFGRTGTWFGIEHSGVVPDIVTTAKALGGGLPLGGVTARAELMDAVHVGGLGGTFGGNPLACAAALAVIDTIEGGDLLSRSARLGERLMGALRGLKERIALVGDVRGLGSMVAMELVEDRETKEPAKEAASRVIKECYERGLIVLKAGTYDNVVRLLPPLSMDDALVERGLELLGEAVSAAASA
jgi:4-aminobutyrate aminotransferase/(S)-3-amino-2-methylpropionate transaminase